MNKRWFWNNLKKNPKFYKIGTRGRRFFRRKEKHSHGRTFLPRTPVEDGRYGSSANVFDTRGRSFFRGYLVRDISFSRKMVLSWNPMEVPYLPSSAGICGRNDLPPDLQRHPDTHRRNEPSAEEGSSSTSRNENQHRPNQTKHVFYPMAIKSD